MNKSTSASKFPFHFPAKYHVSFTRDTPRSFSKNRPKYLRSLEINPWRIELLRPMTRSLKHIKYASSIKSSFSKTEKNRTVDSLRPCIKTAKHIQILGVNHSFNAVTLANRNFSDLKSYSIQFLWKETLECFAKLRKAETIRITFQKMIMGPVMDPAQQIIEERHHLKRIVMKNLILEIPKASPKEMMELAGSIPKSANLHFELESLPLTFRVNEYEEELCKKIKSIKLRSLTNSYLNSMVSSAGFLRNLTHLHLGKSSSVGVLELNQHSNYSLFSKLDEFKGLKSLKLNLRFGGETFPALALQFFKQIKLPVGLEVFSLDLDGIEMKEGSSLKLADFKWIVWQIEQMEELKALRLNFGMSSVDKKSLNDFVSMLPKGLPKLEVLFTDIKVKEGEIYVHTDKVFEWVQSHPIVRNVQLDIPLINYFEMEKKKTFDYEMKHLGSLGLSISHEKVVVKDYFEDFLVFLAKQEGLKCLNLRMQKSWNYVKTMEMMNKYLGAMAKLEDLRIEFKEHEGREFEEVFCLKPLIKKVRWFSLVVHSKMNVRLFDELCKIVSKELADEGRKKGKILEISLNNAKLSSYL